MFKLRIFQVGLINQTRASLKLHKSTLLQSPTGSGKTALAAYMIGNARQRKVPCLFIVHRRELVKQSAAAFHQQGISHGIIAAGFAPRPEELIQICSIQTLVRRIAKGQVARPGLVVWDEAHHMASRTWKKVFEMFAGIPQVGLTATPERLDGKGLGDYFKDMVIGPSVRSLVDDGFLVDYKVFAPTRADLSGVKVRGGDFDMRDYSKIADNVRIVGDAVAHYQKLSPGRQAVVFSFSIEHSKYITQQFQASGIAADHIDGEMDIWRRDIIIEKFRSGEIKVLSNVEIIGEGFDLPDIQTAILTRPTQSLGLFLQQVGRALRPVYAPGYDLETREGRLAAIAASQKPYAIILDHVGNIERHGLPCDTRDWKLEGFEEQRRSKNSGHRADMVRTCGKCFAVSKMTATHCRNCGIEFPVESPRDIEQVEGELQEVNITDFRQNKKLNWEAHAPKDNKEYNYLVKLGKQKGYKDARKWAWYVWQSRQNKKIRNRNTKQNSF